MTEYDSLPSQTSLLDQHEPLGLAGDLFETIFNVCAAVSSTLEETEYSKRLREELERFFLWGDGFSAFPGGLDTILTKSAELHLAVLSSLYELGTVVNDDLLRMVDKSSASQTTTTTSSQEKLSRLWSLLEKVATVLDATEATSDFGSFSGDESPNCNFEEILDDMGIYIDCLMDLSPPLENPVVDLEPGHPAGQSLDTFEFLTFGTMSRDFSYIA